MSLLLALVGGSPGTATGSASFSFGVSGVGAATATSTGSAAFSFGLAGVGTGITASVGTVSFAFDVTGVGRTAGGVVSAVGTASFAFDVTGVGGGIGGVTGGGGPRPRQKVKPILYVGPRPIEEAVQDTREAVAALAEDAAEVENRRKRKRISAAIEALRIEILELENAATAAEARILIGMIERETARVAKLIEAAQAAQDDEEEVELLLLA